MQPRLGKLNFFRSSVTMVSERALTLSRRYLASSRARTDREYLGRDSRQAGWRRKRSQFLIVLRPISGETRSNLVEHFDRQAFRIGWRPQHDRTHLPRLNVGVLTAVMRAPFNMQSEPEESCG